MLHFPEHPCSAQPTGHSVFVGSSPTDHTRAMSRRTSRSASPAVVDDASSLAEQLEELKSVVMVQQSTIAQREVDFAQQFAELKDLISQQHRRSPEPELAAADAAAAPPTLTEDGGTLTPLQAARARVNEAKAQSLRADKAQLKGDVPLAKQPVALVV